MEPSQMIRFACSLMLAALLVACASSPLAGGGDWSRAMRAAWSHEAIVEAFRKQFGGLEPAHRRGLWGSMPDDRVVLESICDHFDLHVRSGGGGKNDWAV